MSSQDDDHSTMQNPCCVLLLDFEVQMNISGFGSGGSTLLFLLLALRLSLFRKDNREIVFRFGVS